MMFLLRFAFWILVICLLLPGQPHDNQRLISSAERTVSDVRGFCSRNPQVCEDARILMTSFLAKFKNGAELMQTWLAKNEGRGSGAGILFSGQPLAEKTEPAPAEAPQPLPAAPKWEDSLSPSDKEVPWQGPSPALAVAGG
jgi:Family of unknown function (DUF5330)